MPAFVATDITVVVQEQSIVGKKKLNRVNITFGDAALTYPTGGIPMPGFAAFGMIRNLEDIVITGVNGLTTDYMTKYDRVNNKLQLFEEEAAAAGGPLLEADAAEAPAARTYFAQAIGW